MDLHTRLRESLQAKGDEFIPSSELKAKVISNFANRRKGRMRNKLIKMALAAAILIPVSAFSYQSYLADGLYGSFDNLKKHIASATMEGYFLLNAKLTQAKGDLGESDYEKFKKEVTIITHAKLQYGDRYGNINYDKVPPEKVRELEKVYIEIQPFFDRLNGQRSSKDVLTAQEYKEYIEAQMTYEKLRSQSGINPKKIQGKEDLPPNVQDEYQKAINFIRYVNNKQIQ
ncbi:DUF3600 domain-containing protein [Bacillus sp. BRMEA1]|uniref:DUF3600 domain-containing protein n=1 Tax=Neobacillus endophyticus TaxID=2738405 RepID=UPI0015679862|nr:DUF3600 domain-containing protein [Neobacillus endophyticus]NRD76812.1 DUF3600 domain-containing protein [Neobacillus endophyticus]